MLPPSAASRLLLAGIVTVLVAGLQLPAGAAVPESYVAMGDSFTAGPGILLQRLEPVGCFRSDDNYPSLVARAG